MADFDTNRAAFVQQEYRRVTKTAPAVLARNASARVVQIDTQLDATAADALAAKYLAANSAPRGFEVVLEGVMFLDTLVGACPSFIPNFPKFNTDGRSMKLMGFTTDADANTTTLQVRG
jgi:hypothetical protein